MRTPGVQCALHTRISDFVLSVTTPFASPVDAASATPSSSASPASPAILALLSSSPNGRLIARPWNDPSGPALVLSRSTVALPDDLVHLRPAGTDSHNQTVHTVVRVLDRPNARVKGRVESVKNISTFRPDDRRLPPVPVKHAPCAHVIAAYTDDLSTANVLFAVAEWTPAAAMSAARHFRPQPSNNPAFDGPIGDRLDVRDLPLVTIDGDDTRDFDDAVHAVRTESGFTLSVAVADVSHYVRPGTDLDAAARLSATSTYLPGSVVPMLPPELSDDVCSLRPDVDRLCVLCRVELDTAGAIQSWTFQRALMRSAARLTYTEVSAFLDGSPSSLSAKVQASLRNLDELYQILATGRPKAVRMERVERRFHPDGASVRTSLRGRNRAEKLIEECMVIANQAAALQIKMLGHEAPFRVHAAPSDSQMQAARSILSVLPAPPKVTGIAPVLLARADAHTDQHGVFDAAIRKMLNSAAYHPDSTGHSGLSIDDYAHFTSPIRRYPDLLVHRALLDGQPLCPNGTPPESLCAELTVKERSAAKVERWCQNVLKAFWAVDRVGQEMQVTTTVVRAKDVIVESTEWGISGPLLDPPPEAMKPGAVFTAVLLSSDPASARIRFRMPN